MPVAINNLTENKVDDIFIGKIIKVVLEGEKPKGNSDISLAFVGPGRMQKLNKVFRKKNRATDVLSFPEAEIPFGKFKIGKATISEGLGEIVICLREVKKNAMKFANSFEQEFARIIVHGVLHLLGYDHEKSKQEAEKMEKKEEEYLRKAGSL